MQQLIDIGNTLLKTVIVDTDKTLFIGQMELSDVNTFQSLHHQFGFPASCLISSVRDIPDWLIASFGQNTRISFLTHMIPLPFSLNYNTPATLGPDRIAAVAAAWERFPNKNVLIIDMGTCITYDIITSQGVYEGGAISPGIRMRLKALHSYTGKLPLVEPAGETPFTGKSTVESILAGVMFGVQAEIDQFIQSYEKIYEELTVIVGGGDNKYFDKQFKNNIFAASNLVLDGLRVILDFNENQHID
ncbi:MAG: type III pantothenate kinase [Bacteroidales bacterium]|nr:type III pantothenate kinase [Bacteroidales bacterium]